MPPDLNSMITRPTDSPNLKVLIYGYPGVGKTILAASAPRPIIIDVEHGTTSLLQFPEYMNTAILKYQSTKTIDTILAATRNGELTDFDTLVIDSFSELQKLVLDEQISTNSGKDKYIPDLQAYSLNTNMLRAVVARLRGIPKHVIITAHVKEEQDAIGRTTLRPDLTPKLANSLIGLMDVVMYMDIQIVKTDGQEKTIRRGTLTPTKSFVAKSRIGGTQLTNPTFNDLLNLSRVAISS